MMSMVRTTLGSLMLVPVVPVVLVFEHCSYSPFHPGIDPVCPDLRNHPLPRVSAWKTMAVTKMTGEVKLLI